MTYPLQQQGGDLGQMTDPDIHRIYIAGPMTGLPDFNHPLFNSEAARLRALGYEVVNPTELYPHTDRTWEFYMRGALTAMLKCDTIYMLRDWPASKGAGIEWMLAQQLNFTVKYQGEL